MIGADLSYNFARGGGAFGVGFGLEGLAGPDFVAGYLSFNASLSIGGTSGLGVSGKAGLVFGADSKEDYEGAFRNVSVRLDSLPSKLQRSVAKQLSQYLNASNRHLSKLLGLHPAGSLWVTAAASMFGEINSRGICPGRHRVLRALPKMLL